MNDLAVLESVLNPLAPKFADVLGRIMPPERLIRTVMSAAGRNPDLLACNRQSLLNAAMTFAVLGLEVDGVTGQGFLVPFKVKQVMVVQPIIGYLGYNTLAARAKMTVTGRVVREGDGFEFDEGRGEVHHVRKLGGETGPNARRIIAVWSKAAALDRPPVVRVLSIDQVLAIKAKSPRGDQPPWSDPHGGFEAMAEKTAKRRLRRDMPLNVYQLAGAMEEAHEERRLHSWIDPSKGILTDGDETPAPRDVTPTAGQLIEGRDLRSEASMAAERGTAVFDVFCRRLKPAERAAMQQYLDELKPVAEAANKEIEQ